ncbi:protein-L-isoaspartate(D-aspartate) O-methyltransferase [Psychromonas ossibalaenae]|uniref:protein-L-isoaspartate(D-aspartate) O-methyltransferase n=1 Tax=Psychromonas ossibalaenae TaxID=444922 RepID=UPI00035E559E|nr:protein-L-isoaspartate(D-aspartate) O-methyltransferase [Psychromonas ossibalaenae]
MDYSTLRELMVMQQISARGITNKAVLCAMKTVPRHLFVSQPLIDEAYGDFPLPIGLNQTISQPYIVALMTEQLQLQADHKVLEIGTGCGYQTAVLAEIVDQVYTIEIVPELAERARQTLKRLNYHNIHSRCGDGLNDWSEQAPFDRIIVTAAPDILPQALIEQLSIGGHMVIPIGSLQQVLYRITRLSENQIETQVLSQVRFVTMTGKIQEREL